MQRGWGCDLTRARSYASAVARAIARFNGEEPEVDLPEEGLAVIGKQLFQVWVCEETRTAWDPFGVLKSAAINFHGRRECSPIAERYFVSWENEHGGRKADTASAFDADMAIALVGAPQTATATLQQEHK